jgi:hypothetical protein
MIMQDYPMVFSFGQPHQIQPLKLPHFSPTSREIITFHPHSPTPHSPHAVSQCFVHDKREITERKKNKEKEKKGWILFFAPIMDQNIFFRYVNFTVFPFRNYRLRKLVRKETK